MKLTLKYAQVTTYLSSSRLLRDTFFCFELFRSNLFLLSLDRLCSVLVFFFLTSLSGLDRYSDIFLIHLPTFILATCLAQFYLHWQFVG